MNKKEWKNNNCASAHKDELERSIINMLASMENIKEEVIRRNFDTDFTSIYIRTFIREIEQKDILFEEVKKAVELYSEKTGKNKKLIKIDAKELLNLSQEEVNRLRRKYPNRYLEDLPRVKLLETLRNLPAEGGVLFVDNLSETPSDDSAERIIYGLHKDGHCNPVTYSMHNEKDLDRDMEDNPLKYKWLKIFGCTPFQLVEKPNRGVFASSAMCSNFDIDDYYNEVKYE